MKPQPGEFWIVTWKDVTTVGQYLGDDLWDCIGDPTERHAGLGFNAVRKIDIGAPSDTPDQD